MQLNVMYILVYVIFPKYPKYCLSRKLLIFKILGRISHDRQLPFTNTIISKVQINNHALIMHLLIIFASDGVNQ